MNDKTDLQVVPDEEMVTVRMTKAEYGQLMDLVELMLHTQAYPDLYKEMDKKPKKQDSSAIAHYQDKIRSIEAIMERLMAAE